MQPINTIHDLDNSTVSIDKQLYTSIPVVRLNFQSASTSGYHCLTSKPTIANLQQSTIQYSAVQPSTSMLSNLLPSNVQTKAAHPTITLVAPIIPAS